MKRYMYVLSVISAGILTYLFIRRGNLLAAALAVGAIAFYAFGLANDIRRARSGSGDDANALAGGAAASGTATQKGSAVGESGKDKAAILAELRELLATHTRYMRIYRNASVTLSLFAAMLVFVNESLAITILIIALFALFKFWQNLRAVRLIRKGAGNQLDQRSK